jgi:hypothetical protein
VSVHDVQGRQRTSQRLRLTAEQWRSTHREDFIVTGLEACLDTFDL